MEWLFISLIVSIVSAPITLVIFHSKGRSIWGGLFLGFFLGIVGIIIALFIPADPEKLSERRFTKGEFAQCPHCKEYIRIDATTCKHCHQPLSPGTVITAEQLRSEEKRRWIEYEQSHKEDVRLATYFRVFFVVYFAALGVVIFLSTSEAERYPAMAVVAIGIVALAIYKG